MRNDILYIQKFLNTIKLYSDSLTSLPPITISQDASKNNSVSCSILVPINCLNFIDQHIFGNNYDGSCIFTVGKEENSMNLMIFKKDDLYSKKPAYFISISYILDKYNFLPNKARIWFCNPKNAEFINNFVKNPKWSAKELENVKKNDGTFVLSYEVNTCKSDSLFVKKQINLVARLLKLYTKHNISIIVQKRQKFDTPKE